MAVSQDNQMRTDRRPARAWLALAAVLLIVAVGSAEAFAASAKVLHARAMKAFKKGELEAAAVLFRKAFEVEPEPAFLYSEASCYRRLGEVKKSADLYEKYLVLVPEGERPEERAKAIAHAAAMHLQLGVTLREGGDCAAAITEFERSLVHVPDAGVARYNTGLCRESLAYRTLARVAYEKALADGELDPKAREDAESRLHAIDAALSPPPESGPAAVAPAPGEHPASSPASRPSGGVGVLDAPSPEEVEKKRRKRKAKLLRVLIPVASIVVTVAVAGGIIFGSVYTSRTVFTPNTRLDPVEWRVP